MFVTVITYRHVTVLSIYCSYVVTLRRFWLGLAL